MGWGTGLTIVTVLSMSIDSARVPLLCRRSHRTWANQVESAAQVESRLIGRLFCGHRPQVEGIADPAALEALENVLALIRGEAATCA
jgi:hypothetical protein